MKLSNLLTIALNNLNSEKNKSFVCIQIKDIINCTGYLIVFGGTKNGITSIKPFKKSSNRNQFISVTFDELDTFLPNSTSINIRVSDESTLQRTIYDIFYDIPREDEYM